LLQFGGRDPDLGIETIWLDVFASKGFGEEENIGSIHLSS
jgi:hypothetical protein